MTSRFNLDPLRIGGYQRYLLATMLASLSLWVYQPSLEWVVLRETGATAAVGSLETVLIVPVALATLPSGMLADRLGPRRLLALSLAGIALCVSTVAALAVTGHLTFEAAVIVTIVLGIFDGLYGVPVQLLLNHLVPPQLLGSAIGLSMLTTGLGRLIGAPLGGAVLQAFGSSQAFVPAALGLFLSVGAVYTIPLVRGDGRIAAGQGIGSLRNSLAWIRGEPAALTVTLLGAIAASFVLGYSALMPTVTRDLLHANSGTLGLLAGAGGPASSPAP